MGDFQIKSVPIDSIRPYKKNPRKNDAAVSAVARSIESFGFKQPIVVDQKGVIVAGHTRYKAAKELHLDHVPVIICDDLSPKQVKAYRLADNKAGEIATWDSELLDFELSDLSDFPMTDFGFEGTMQEIEQSFSAEEVLSGRVSEAEAELQETESEQAKEKKADQAYYGDERERTFNAYNLYHFNENACCGKFDMPIIYAEKHICKDFIGFNYALSSDQYKSGIHFFLDDYQFERLWSAPEKYLETLSLFDCCLTPDFSLYLEMPTAMKIWNIYRSRLIGQLLQNSGIKTIPTLSWAEKESFAYCFDGIEPGGTVAVSTIGVKRSEKAGIIWKEGMAEALRRLSPSCVLLYGGEIDFNFGKTKTVDIQNEVTARWKMAKVKPEGDTLKDLTDEEFAEVYEEAMAEADREIEKVMNRPLTAEEKAFLDALDNAKTEDEKIRLLNDLHA